MIYDMIFALKMIVGKTWEWNKKKYVAFIDLEKAFDRVPRQKLWAVLEDEYHGIPPKLRRTICNTYQNTKCKVKSQCGSSDWFEVKSGVCQGSVLLPVLFILLMDKCLRELYRQENPVNEVTDLVYADDHAMIVDTQEDLQDRIELWNEISSYDMKISKDKMWTLFISRTPNDKYTLGWTNFKPVQKFQVSRSNVWGGKFIRIGNNQSHK